MNIKYPKQRFNLRNNEKKSLAVQKFETKTQINDTEKNLNMFETHIDQVIASWDNMFSKLKIFNDQNTTTELTNGKSIPTESEKKLSNKIETESKSKKLPKINTQKLNMKINNLKTDKIVPKIDRQNVLQNKTNNRIVPKFKVNTSMKNLTPSNTNQLELMKSEIEQLNDKLKTITVELATEKSNYIVLMNSYTAALDRCQTLELEQKTSNISSYKVKLDEMFEKLENVNTEKNELQKCLDESKTKLAYVNKQIDSSDHNVVELMNKLREFEEERHGWNEYQIKLENQISNDQNALARKEQYIKNQDIMIDDLSQEKHELKMQLNRELELESRRSTESENQLKKLTTVITDMISKFTTTEESYDKEILELRNTIENQEKLINKKNKLIQQQEEKLNMMKEITPDMENDLIMSRYKWL